jgi:hypothetical protein
MAKYLIRLSSNTFSSYFDAVCNANYQNYHWNIVLDQVDFDIEF